MHFFDIAIAEELGVNAAIVLSNLEFWIKKNIANGKHFHEGRYWTYNSVKAFDKLFPYLTTNQIRTAIDKLVDGGYVLKGNFNKVNYDKTTWYALSAICDETQIEVGSIPNRSGFKPEPIPDNNTDRKTDTCEKENSPQSLADSQKPVKEKVQVPLLDNDKILWVSENCPTLLTMKEPLSSSQALWFSENYPEDVWQDIMEAMENYADLKKKSKSANLTARKWLRMRGWLPYDKMKTATYYEAKSVMGQNPRAFEIYKNKNPQSFINK